MIWKIPFLIEVTQPPTEVVTPSFQSPLYSEIKKHEHENNHHTKPQKKKNPQKYKNPGTMKAS